MTTTGSRRPRPHPARRARKLAGTVSIAGMFALTGCMAATAKTATAKTATAATTTTAAPTTTDRSTTTAAAVAGNATGQSDTASHAS